ncbi:MAG: cytochrome c [Gemmatimonadales bacterium]
MARKPFARLQGRVASVLALALLGGCNFYYDTVPSPDDLMKLVPWFDHMVTSPAIFPYSSITVPREAVPGTVPITGGEADWRVGAPNPATLVYAFDSAAAANLVNPLAPSEMVARGDTLYGYFCAVCHGGLGAGDGPVGRRVGALSLLTPKARALTDGYLYSLIRYGRGVMPVYGDKIYDQRDRWAVVNYVRALQGAAGAAQ